MFNTLNKIFKRFQKTPVIVENFNSNGYSDILIICAKENIPLYGFDGENLEKRMKQWVKAHRCKIVSRFTNNVGTHEIAGNKK